MKKLLNALLLAAVTIFAASCIADASLGLYGPDRNAEGQTDVLLRLRTPGGFTSPQSKTRGLTFTDENTIDNVYVLVFDANDKLIDIKEGKDATGGPNDEYTGPGGSSIYSGEGSFSVTLPQSEATGANATSKLVVLANAGTILEETLDTDFADYKGPSSKAYNDVIAAVYTALTAKYSATTIPMWGETAQIPILPTTKPSITLTRAIARIDVGVGSPSYTDGEDYPYEWDGLGADGDDADNEGDPIPFKLESVHVIRPNNKYAVIPNATKLSASEATIAQGTGKFNADDTDAAKFAFTDVIDNLYNTQSIYVPEADIKMGGTTSGDDNHTNRMAIVVGGVYDENGDGSFAEGTSYYRLDFANSGTLMNVLRNHLYQFNISSVSGKGYSDPITAYTARSMNMTVEILEWDAEHINDIAFDGTYYFGISRREVLLSGEGETTQVSIKTNVKNFTLNIDGGAAELVADDPAKQTCTVGGIVYTLSGPAGGDIYTLSIAAPRNPSTSGSILHEWDIAANRLTMDLRVIQDVGPVPGVRSVAGVIGYYANGDNKGQLTLEGDDGDDTDIIYVAYFKFGSLVATSSQNNGYFTSADIIAVPEKAGFPYTLDEYKDNITGSGQPAWEMIDDAGDATTGRPAKANDEIPTELAKGLGDACTEYFGAGWRMPTARENYGFVGSYPNWATTQVISNINDRNQSSTYDYWDYGQSHAGSVADPHTGSFPLDLQGDSQYHPAHSQVLPVAGYRFTNGSVYNRGVSAYYWSSTALNSSYGYNLCFFNEYVRPSYANTYDNGFTIRCVQTEPEPEVRSDVIFAAPGMVGIKKSDYDKLVSGELTLKDDNDKYSLTLRGSSTYAKTEVPAEFAYIEDNIAAEFGGLESEPVYAVYFKWGSMVAMIGGHDDDWSADDVVWVNDDFAGTITDDIGVASSDGYYGDFSAAVNKSVNGDYDITDAPALGHGDICKELTGGTYRTPRGNPWYGTEKSDWSQVATVDFGFGYGVSIVNSDGTIFLPPTGFCSEEGYIRDLGDFGYYWSSTAEANNRASLLYFDDSEGAGPNSGDGSFGGFPIRCVQPEPEPEPVPAGVHAAPGVIGYKANGELTLKGSSVYDSNDGIKKFALDNFGGLENEPVYIAYFKFGSLVATSGGDGNGDQFDKNDIIAVPKTTDNFPYTLDAYKTYVDGGSTAQNKWNRIDDAGDYDGVTLEEGQNVGTDLTKGLGDPCAYWFDGVYTNNWRLPLGGTSDRPNTPVDGWNAGTFGTAAYEHTSSNHNSTWYAIGAPGLGSGIPAGRRGSSGWEWYLPAAGLRYGAGDMNSQGSVGSYWSSTAVGGTNGYDLNFDKSRSIPSNFSSYASGLAIRCVQPAPEPDGGQNHVLYFSDNTIKIGRWGAPHADDTGLTVDDGHGGKQAIEVVTDVADLAFFKFGGVVGFTNVKAWNSLGYDPIEFDPTPNAGAYLPYGNGGLWAEQMETDNSLANGYVPGFVPSDYDTRGIRNVSDPAYHNETNLRAGKGDPCKLAGIDLSRIDEANYLKNYDSGWRLPTLEENRMFVGLEPNTTITSLGRGPYYDTSGAFESGSTTSEGVFPSNSHAPGITLPAAGCTSGVPSNRGTVGYYWSSTAFSATKGYQLYIETVVNPSYTTGSISYGQAVRCVLNL